MDNLPNTLSALDQWLNRSWMQVPEDYRWLVLQTLATAQSRRAWIASWPSVPGQLVLDLGCGPGLVAQEIASLKACRVIGSDIDPNVLDLAQSINRLFADGTVKFRLGDILDEPKSDERAAAACVRFVAQYTPDLDRFMAGVKNRVAPGGYIAIEDIDDGYLIEYPAAPESWQAAVTAFQQHQSGEAGDRQVGRKLAGAGVRAGLTLEALEISPSAQAGLVSPDDLSVQFDIDRIGRAVPDMIREHLITEEGWYGAVSEYRQSFPHYSFVSAATVRLLFRVPGE
jgi:SAM-dependent methyltransferase